METSPGTAWEHFNCLLRAAMRLRLAILCVGAWHFRQSCQIGWGETGAGRQVVIGVSKESSYSTLPLTLCAIRCLLYNTSPRSLRSQRTARPVHYPYVYGSSLTPRLPGPPLTAPPSPDLPSSHPRHVFVSLSALRMRHSHPLLVWLSQGVEDERHPSRLRRVGERERRLQDQVAGRYQPSRRFCGCYSR